MACALAWCLMTHCGLFAIMILRFHVTTTGISEKRFFFFFVWSFLGSVLAALILLNSYAISVVLFKAKLDNATFVKKASVYFCYNPRNRDI